MKKYALILVAAFVAMAQSVSAQVDHDDFGVWTTVEVKKDFGKKFDISAEAELRTQDYSQAVERWTVGLGASYKLVSWLKADIGYRFIDKQQLQEVTRKGNVVDNYWSPRHRVYASLTGKVKFGRFEFSLRERYQLTCRGEQYVTKWNAESVEIDPERVKAKNESVLRSRLGVDWNIRKSPFTPFASCEMHNVISDNWEIEKLRWIIGTKYKFNKRHSIEASYVFQDVNYDYNQHILSLGYCYKF